MGDPARVIERAKLLLKAAFLAWGVVSLLGVLALGGCSAYSVAFGNRDRVDEASAPAYLAWAGLPAETRHTLHRSFQSARSFRGAHLDAVAIDVPLLSREGVPDREDTVWMSGPDVDTLLPGVLDTLQAQWAQRGLDWVPPPEILRSPEMLHHPRHITTRNLAPQAVEWVAAHIPSNRMYTFSIRL